MRFITNPVLTLPEGNMGETSKQLQRTVDFTYDWYGDFLDDVKAAGYAFRSFHDDLTAGDVVLRHDVDLSVDDALTMARLEADRDVTATYFVLLSSALYNPLRGETRDAVREIQSLGHEVALHFSTHEYWPADSPPGDDELQARVAEELAILETVTGDDRRLVSFHKPPQWTFARSYDGFTSTYEARFFEDVQYVADSRQRWRDDPPAVEDFEDTVQVLTHPGLWANEDGAFDERIEQAVTASCKTAGRTAGREFLGGW